MTHEAKRIEYEALLLVHLRLKPRDVDQLTIAEFDRMCQYADQIQRSHEEANRR